MSQSNKKSNPADLIGSVVDGLFNFKNSQVLKFANHAIEESNKVMDKLDEKYHVDPMTIEDFLQKISPSIDEKILATAKEENVTPVGGEIRLSINPNTQDVLIVWEFYFINQIQQYKKINSKKVINKDFFITEAYVEIKNNSPVYNIEAPKI